MNSFDATTTSEKGYDSISADHARALILRAQGFGVMVSDDPIAILNRLGVIQLDSVNVLARSHDLIPFARLGPTPIAALHGAIYKEQRGFEYWGHEASWLPIGEYRYFKPRMAARRQRWAEARREHAELYPAVLERITAEGALGAADFEDPRESRGTWWDWKPAKFVLEDLFALGELMCRERRPGFSRRYDLPERVLPPTIDTTDPGSAAATRHLLMRAITALGVATCADAIDYFRLPLADARSSLRELVADGALHEVAVEGWKTIGLVAPTALETSTAFPSHDPTFLSPFDNLVWYRERVERVFNFRYRIEIYVPGPKREFGYYVLPLLVEGRLVGRADLKLDRPARALLVRGIWLDSLAYLEDAARALRSLAVHLGSDHIVVERAEPTTYLDDLRRWVS